MSGRNRGDEPLVIVCVYPDGRLASDWFRAYQRVKRTVRRGSFRARVELRPVSELPEWVDVLIAPLEPHGLADAAPGALDRIVAAPDALRVAFDALLERLVSEGRLQHAPAPARALATHHGFRAVGERARLAD
jgi:hypothetical protein